MQNLMEPDLALKPLDLELVSYEEVQDIQQPLNRGTLDFLPTVPQLFSPTTEKLWCSKKKKKKTVLFM
jgi:hypothetical protein